MKTAIVIAVAIGILLLIRSGTKEHDGPGWVNEKWDEAGIRFKRDWKSEAGRAARDMCSQRLGITISVETAVDVARHYDAQKAGAWTNCIVDTMYPEPGSQK